MRHVVLALGLSLDGYIARPDGAVDFLFIPKDYSMRALRAFQATIDTVIMGRKTLDVAVKMTGGNYHADVPTYVFSRTQPPRQAGRPGIRQPVAGIAHRKIAQTPRQGYLVDGRRRAGARLPQRRSDRCLASWDRPHPDRRRHPAIPQRVPATRIQTGGEPYVFQRPRRPPVPTRPAEAPPWPKWSATQIDPSLTAGAPIRATTVRECFSAPAPYRANARSHPRSTASVSASDCASSLAAVPTTTPRAAA